MPDFDLNLSADEFASPAETRMRRERMASDTMHAVAYEEARRILATVASPGDVWEEAFSRALESAKGGVFLAGKFDADVTFIVAAALGKGVWFSPGSHGSGCAKGLIPEQRVSFLLDLAKRKGLI